MAQSELSKHIEHFVENGSEYTKGFREGQKEGALWALKWVGIYIVNIDGARRVMKEIEAIAKE